MTEETDNLKYSEETQRDEIDREIEELISQKRKENKALLKLLEELRKKNNDNDEYQADGGKARSA